MADQRSPEWFAARAGKITGSKFADAVARNKKTGEPLKAFYDLAWQLVVERMTGAPIEGPSGYALQWGTDVEPAAREAYELYTGNSVEESDFIVHPKYDFAGCSPDGIVNGGQKGLEMKCPKDSRIHLDRFITGVPDEYVPQIQGGMWVTGMDEWDFVSYDPRMPISHSLLVITVKRDDDYIKKLEESILAVESLANELMKEIQLKGQK